MIEKWVVRGRLVEKDLWNPWEVNTVGLWRLPQEFCCEAEAETWGTDLGERGRTVGLQVFCLDFWEA